MKKINIALLILVLLSIFHAKAQFQIIRSTADSLREEGDLQGAIEEYKKRYANEPSNKTNLFNYACALSVNGSIDSGYKYVYLCIQSDTSTGPLTDPDFLPLREDKRWDQFESHLISMLQIKFNDPYKDIEYAKQLWKLHALDQAYYGDIKIAEKKIGMRSTVVLALWDIKHKINDQNQKELEALIEKKGWPKNSQVGSRAAGSAFLIIQHSDAEKRKKYLPVIEKLCKENEASWQDYALMFDRVQTNDNKPQKYGSQVRFNDATKKYELFPLMDETKVDDWRKEAGLVPLAEYVSMWGIKFEPKKK